jgi:2-oxoglutarate dehydrogenase E2 component (dihydrolipoamide succinyltransferase)
MNSTPSTALNSALCLSLSKPPLVCPLPPLSFCPFFFFFSSHFFSSSFLFSASAALQQFPDVNAYWDADKKEIVYHDFVDVSVAVATPKGLVVPVIRNTESMNFAQVEAAIAAYGQQAKKGTMAIESMIGGTFTISNGGVYGSLMGTPIINPPQTAILGMHGIFNRPIAEGDKVVIKPMMYVALTYDHRLIDGATGVQFLKKVKELVEDPARFVFDL